MPFPRPLTDYATAEAPSLWVTLVGRASAEPFNVVASAVFLLAVLHTFLSAAKQQKPKLMAMLAQLQLPKKLVHSLQRLRQPVAFLSAQVLADIHSVC